MRSHFPFKRMWNQFNFYCFRHADSPEVLMVRITDASAGIQSGTTRLISVFASQFFFECPMNCQTGRQKNEYQEELYASEEAEYQSRKLGCIGMELGDGQVHP